MSNSQSLSLLAHGSVTHSKNSPILGLLIFPPGFRTGLAISGLQHILISFINDEGFTPLTLIVPPAPVNSVDQTPKFFPEALTKI